MLMPQKSVKALALSLTLCLLPFSVHSKADDKGDKNKPLPPAVPLLAGKLVTRGNQPVLVNGNIVGTGTTILTGTTIQTFNGTRASVRIGTLGNFELAPNSSATLVFNGHPNSGQISGILKRGCATLTANTNIAGSLTTPDGMMTKTDSSRLSSVNVCTADAGNSTLSDPLKDLNPSPPADDSRSKGIFGLGANSGTTWGLLTAASYFVGTGTARLVINPDANGNGCGNCCCCCGMNPSPCRP